MSSLTLFSDASFDNSSGAGGWGAWAKHSSWPAGVLFGGPMKLLMGSSSDAEIMAISTALHRLPKLGAFDNTRTVMIQSDSVRALGLMAAWIPDCRVVPGRDTAEIRLLREKLSEYEGRAIAAMRILGAKYALAFQLSHVRAHSRGPGSSPMNRECDRLARSAMRDRRKLLSPPGHRPTLLSKEDVSDVLEMMVRAFGAEIGREVKVAGAVGRRPVQVKGVAQKKRRQKNRGEAHGGIGSMRDGTVDQAIAPPTKRFRIKPGLGSSKSLMPN